MPIKLGTRSYVGSYDLRFGGDVVIGHYSSIADGCMFLCGQVVMHASAGTQYVSNYPFAHIDKGGITIGNDVWIGSNVIIMPGVKISDGAQVAAGAVISRDVPPFAVVVGNPQLIKKYRFTPEIIAALLRIRWWEWPPESVDQVVKQGDFVDAAAFVEKHLHDPAVAAPNL